MNGYFETMSNYLPVFITFVIVTVSTTERCYYECPMEGIAVDLSKYPTVSNKTVQLEKLASMTCPTRKRGRNLKWVLATKDEFLFDGTTRVTNDSRFAVYDNVLTISRADVEHKGVYVCYTKYGRAIAAVVLDVQDRPPEFHWKTDNKTATVGDRAHLECNAHNLRLETMEHMNWTFTDKLISVEGTSLVESRFNFWGWSLTINEVKVSDKGPYTCYIDTGVGIMEKTTYLDVYTPPTLYSTTPNGVEVIEGTNVALTCKSSSRPAAWIRWTTNYYRDMHCMNDVETITGCSLNETVLIKNVTRGCRSVFNCEARNDIYTYPGSDGRESFYLSVTYTPEIAITQRQISVTVGDAATVACQSWSNPHSKPNWIKDGTELILSDKYHFGEKGPMFFLTIYNTQISDRGTYVCQGQNYAGIGSDSVQLIVIPSDDDSPIREILNSTKCETIHIPTCQGLWYKSTPKFPSILHPEATYQTDILPVMYSHAANYNPTPRCEKFMYVHCARNMPPCTDDASLLLPCRKICETAKSECSEYSYGCSDLPSSAPCTTPEGPVTLEMTVDTEIEATYNHPLTIKCGVRTNAKVYYMFFGKNNEHDVLHNSSSGYVTVTQTEKDGWHLLEAHYTEFRTTNIKQFICVLRTEAFDVQKTTLVKISDNLEIVPLPESVNYVYPAQDKTISCKVYSRFCNISNTSWKYYGGLPVQPSDNLELSTRSINENTLIMEMTISNVTTENSHSYECLASNTCGETSKTIINLSAGSVPNVVASSHEVHAVIGAEATLECSYKNNIYPNPNVNILWKRGIEVISRDSETPGFKPFNQQLIVLDVTKQHFGNYICFAKNQFGWTYQVITLKEIPGIPPIVEMNFDAKGNNDVVVDCTIYSRTNVSLTWFKSQNQLSLSDNAGKPRKKYLFEDMTSTLVEGYKISRFTVKKYLETKARLTIKRFSPEDLDIYTCIGNNEFGNASAGYNFSNYIMAPEIIHSYSQNVRTSLAERARLMCHIRSDLKLRTAWKRNGEYLETSQHYKVYSEKRFHRTRSYLEIFQVTEQDLGDYICEAENELGKDRRKIALSEER